MGDIIENIITQNREQFNDKVPGNNHEEKFLYKLTTRIKHFISIVPYLIKVLIVTVVIFISSIIIWDSYIRKDRHEISLKEKIVNITHKKI